MSYGTNHQFKSQRRALSPADEKRLAALAEELGISDDDDQDDEAESAQLEERLVPVREYFSDIAAEGLAPFQCHEPRGDVFLDLTVENIRFKAFIAQDGPYLSAERRGGVSLGAGSISVVDGDFGSAREVGCWVCKYWNQPHIDLNALTPAGRRTVAVQFGLLMHAYAFRTNDAFYASPAFEALKQWAMAHPRKIKRFGRSVYLGDWAKLAQG